MIARQVVLCWGSAHKVYTLGVANIARRQYIINTSLPGLVGNMARHCTRVQHFPSPTARENTCTHSCNISPYWETNPGFPYRYHSMAVGGQGRPGLTDITNLTILSLDPDMTTSPVSSIHHTALVQSLEFKTLIFSNDFRSWSCMRVHVCA